MTNDYEPRSDQLAKRVLDRIEGERLIPRPRWEFLFKNYFFWTLGALAVAFGALAFSAALFEIENAGWRFSAATHGDLVTFFFAAAPFLWVLVLALFILIGYVNVRRTDGGYRYPLAVIALGAVLTSIALGSGIYAAGLGGEIEQGVGDHPPFYRPIMVEEQSWWLAPAKGLLGGQVVSVAADASSFVLQDFSGATWTIDASDVRGTDLTTLARGGVVRVVGAPQAATSSTAFHACFVFPWATVGGYRDQPAPLPLAVFASTSERSSAPTRSQLCKGIRPYEKLRTIDGNGF